MDGGKELQTFKVADGFSYSAFHAALTPDGKTLVSSGLRGRLLVWDAATGKEVQVR